MSRLLATEKVGLVWAVLTSVLLAFQWEGLNDGWGMVLTRVEWGLATAALVAVGWRWPGSLTDLVRSGAQLGWLASWYSETYELNRWRENLDWVFASADWQLFGCQPSLEMSRVLSGPVWSEAFNLGYWSYFPMIAVLVLGVAWQQWKGSEERNGQGGRDGSCATRPAVRTIRDGLVPHVAAVVLASFFLYYLIYIFVPVAGPQFYFAAIGVEDAAAGTYPQLGTYFATHTEMLTAPGWSDGLFYRLVAMAQSTGERPTAAFPSSHIGISTILLMLAWRHVRAVLPVLVPLWMLLCGATVFIQAHYVVDALAGLLSAPIVLWAARCVVSAVGRVARRQ